MRLWPRNLSENPEAGQFKVSCAPHGSFDVLDDDAQSAGFGSIQARQAPQSRVIAVYLVVAQPVGVFHELPYRVGVGADHTVPAQRSAEKSRLMTAQLTLASGVVFLADDRNAPIRRE